MIKGLYVSKAGMLPRQRQLEINANNLANINTIGYKKDNVFFRHLIDSLQGKDSLNGEREFANGEIATDFSCGPLQETGNLLDLAISDEGFFVIQTPQGNVYTRNGNFTLDPEGRLITQDGFLVMGSGGEIQLAGNNINIAENGSIIVDGEAVDKIRIVHFDDYSRLIKIGGACFSDEEGEAAIEVAPEKIQLRQGYLEGSNVTGIEEIVQMIELYRQFELGQKAIATQDSTLEKLVNDAGRLG